MTWLIYSLLSIIPGIGIGLVSKKILHKESDHHPITYASALFFASASCSLILYGILGIHLSDFIHLLDPKILFVLGIDILCYSLAPSLYYRAFKNLPLSEMTILYSMSGIYIFILSFILGREAFQLNHLLGAIIIFTGIVLVSGRGQKWKTNKYFQMMMGATFIYAIAAITDNELISQGYFSPTFLPILNFGIPGILVLLINPSSQRSLATVYNRKTIPTIFLNGLFFCISFFAVLSAYKSGGEASQVNIVLSTETILIVICAAVFFKERKDLLLKCLAALLATIGVYLLS